MAPPPAPGHGVLYILLVNMNDQTLNTGSEWHVEVYSLEAGANAGAWEARCSFGANIWEGEEADWAEEEEEASADLGEALGGELTGQVPCLH